MRVSAVTATLCWALLAATPSATAAQTPEVLTNNAVVRLVKSGLGSNLIVKMIQDEPSNFTLDSANVIKLKQQGVPQPVIAAMFARQSGQPTGPAKTVPGPKSSQSTTANYAWQLSDQVDPMSGRRDFSALLGTPAISTDGIREGEYELTARCNAGVATLKIVFLPDNNSGVGFKQNTETYLITQGGLFGSMQFESHHKKAWTETRVRFDDQQPFTVTSERDFLNESEVYFLAQRPRDPTNILDAFGLAMNSVGPNKPAGLEQNLFGADRILLESTLDNGVKSIVEIHPQDSGFQAFAGRCKNLIPLPPKPPPPIHTVPQIPVGSRLVFALDELLNVNDMISGKTIAGHLIEPLHAPANARVTLLDMPVGTPVFLKAMFVGITPAEIKRSRSGNNMNPNVRLELDHVVVDGGPLALRASPLDRHAIAFTWAQLPGKDDPKRSVVVQANERLEMDISEPFIPSSVTSPQKPEPGQPASADHSPQPNPAPQTSSELALVSPPANVHLCVAFRGSHACNLFHREGNTLVGTWPNGDVSHMEVEQFTATAMVLNDTVTPAHNKPAVHTVYKADVKNNQVTGGTVFFSNSPIGTWTADWVSTTP